MYRRIQHPYTFLDKLKAIGPGAMITASFIGPGTVTTCTRAGASFGYSLLWAVIFSVLATIILQEMSARLGIITHKGLSEAILEQIEHPFFKHFSIWLVGGSITLGCASYISGDLTGTALGISTITGIPTRVLGPIMGVVVFLLVYKGSFRLLERLLTFLVVVMAVVFVTTMFVAKPNLTELSKGFLPHIDRENIIFVISLVGTTVVPYNFFIHAVSATKNWSKPEELVLSRWDTYVSITVGGIITAAILITSATLMRGIEVKNAADLSIQLEPLLGKWAKIFLSIGLFAAGFSSAIATPMGASYTLAGLLGWKYHNSDRRFKYTNLIIVTIGAVVSGLGLNPLTILLIAQALNGIILPIVTIYLVYITSSKKQMGIYSNTAVDRVLGIIVAAVTLFLGCNALVSALRSLFAMF